MFEYKFVRVELSPFRRRPKQDYQAIVAEHARQGWRLVQIFAPATGGEGAAMYFELIFEKQASSS
ncbi:MULTISPECIES: DUF4177 domain-containing protein [Brevibacillus]|jgi:hypothetical protein|uniref:DUF4177 domain-containing protein n=1 Tax=Brevibacillus borstelensis AK1 TaxID=1300222 RepID=M8D3C4_9BACL|nr:DUF4177 domain-containing protein [Brevibacillus borstelensis]EMT50749.1 hypothetical protein I532_20591 [Brevibacillus borstelensis AK1]KKX55935.1 hypothetical protein X546_09890 [Brevibacillus borstelensis cifa_chp40]MBE5396758.1 DUF4177 domain-containing protein [Brevibacillus borstelensis]MCC0564496.1 DUF4177 domain-containing protein [Brevibacillus borstelensis]MCM3471150.1 DUF4177 domain-containing protein [Brevibacillus borstelensis]